MKTVLNTIFQHSHHKFLLLLALVLYLSPQTLSACQFTDTNLTGSMDICLGDAAQFTRNNCEGWGSLVHEWHIEKCTTNQTSGNCSSFAPYDIVTITSGSTLNYTFFTAGNFRVRLYLRDPGTNTILAYPCSNNGGGNCFNATINVLGADVPFFNITSQSCSYDVQTGNYSQTISIDPRINLTGTNNNGTALDINWGDGTSTNLLSVVSPSFTVQHTYTWTQVNNQNPSFAISVNATTGQCSPQTYSRSHRPFTNFALIIPDVRESSCDEQVVCFNGVGAFDDYHWLDPDRNQFGDNQDCLTFTQPGTYTLVANNPNGCPFTFTYTVNFSPTMVGVLYSNDSYLQPGVPLNLNVNNTTGTYIVYEISSGSCNPTPVWVPFAFGDVASMSNYSVPGYVTQSFPSCMLNSDFEFCIRAKVFCEEPTSLSSPGATTNEVCFKVCAGGGGEPHEGLVDDDEGFEPAAYQGEFETIKTQNEIIVYPNPTSEHLKIEATLPEIETNIKLRLRSLDGRIVFTENYEVKNTPLFQTEIVIPSTPAGMYILELSGKNTNQSKLVVVDN